jgi:hypothetical protein
MDKVPLPNAVSSMTAKHRMIQTFTSSLSRRGHFSRILPGQCCHGQDVLAIAIHTQCLQVICAAIFTALGIGWVHAGFVRNKAIQDVRQRTASVGFENIVGAQYSYTPWRQPLPKLTILVPVAGRRPNTLQNWTALLSMPYPGPLEIILLVHSRSDAAYTAAQELLLAQGSTPRGRNSMRVCVTGLAETCSQKIHNLIVGVRSTSRDSKYVLCMDDDVRMHPIMLQDLVDSLEYDPTTPYMATGCEPSPSRIVVNTSVNSACRGIITTWYIIHESSLYAYQRQVGVEQVPNGRFCRKRCKSTNLRSPLVSLTPPDSLQLAAGDECLGGPHAFPAAGSAGRHFWSHACMGGRGVL